MYVKTNAKILLIITKSSEENYEVQREYKNRTNSLIVEKDDNMLNQSNVSTRNIFKNVVGAGKLKKAIHLSAEEMFSFKKESSYSRLHSRLRRSEL